MNKYYYIMFKILKEYPDSKLFQSAVNGILKLAHKIDSSVIVDITTSLAESDTKMRYKIYDKYQSVY